MAVLALSRRVAGAQSALPRPAELLAHARHLTELERVVETRGEASAADLVQRMQPALAGTRPLAAAVKKLRPLVLVVDDDPFALRLAKLALNTSRWEVHTAGSGPAALALLRRIRPDVVLVDVQMPEMTGIELVARLKATPDLAPIPVMMMTGNARRETLQGSVEAGAVGFIVKPMSAATLEERLDNLVPR
jgi:CheY-like chemotaxis protein